MREQLLAQLRERLKRARDGLDWGAVLEPAALAEEARLLAFGRDVAACEVAGWLRWFRFLASVPDGLDDLAVALDHFEVLLHTAGAGSVPEPLVPAFDATAALPDFPDTATADVAGQIWGYAGVVLLEKGALDRAVHLLRIAVSAVPHDEAAQAMYLSNLGTALVTRFGATGDDADLEEAVKVLGRAVEQTPAGHAKLAIRLGNLGAASRSRFGRTGDRADLDAAIDALELAVSDEKSFRAELRSARRTRSFLDKAAALHLARASKGLSRWEKTGELRQLDRAIDGFRRAASTSADPAPLLCNLGATLMYRFDRVGDEEDLNAAIEALRESAAADHPRRVLYLTNFAIALRERHDRSRDTADLDEAIERLRLASALADRASVDQLSPLAKSLLERFQATGEPDDLTDAIAELRDAVDAPDIDAPVRAELLTNLGTALGDRFERLGQPADLDEAIARYREAAADVPDNGRAILYGNLGTALSMRFEYSGDPTDLDDSIACHREVVLTERAGEVLSGLGNVLRNRFEHTGSQADLAEALSAQREAVAVTPDGHPDRSTVLSNLGILLRRSFERTGDPDMLTEAMSAHRQAVTADDRHPAAMVNLGTALIVRFERDGDLPDLTEAVSLTGRAVTLAQGRSGSAAMLTVHGTALYRRFEVTGQAEDLIAAVAAVRRAIADTPPRHYRLGLRLCTLAAFLIADFDRTGDPTHLREAIEVLESAASGGSQDPRRLNLLGEARSRLFDHSQDDAVLAAAIAAHREALAISPEDDPARATVARGLAATLLQQADHSHDLAAVQQARDALRASARTDTAPIRDRISCARVEAGLAVDMTGLASAAETLAYAVELLPLSLSRHMSRGSAEQWLRTMAGLTSDAAAAALADDDPDRAVGLLELGRGILLGQALDTRTDLTELRHRAPRLARRFEQLCQLLDTEPGGAESITEGTRREWRRAAAEELTALVATIRSDARLPGFLAPPAPAELAAQAADGPIIMINTSQYRCDALVLVPTGVRVVPLPALRLDDIHTHVADFLGAFGSRGRLLGNIENVLEWLWDTVAGPVLEALDLCRAPTGPWPHVWWAPTGLLSLLPLHAAGRHDPGEGARAVLDFVVSSYTPTVRALAHARRARPASGTKGRAVVVGMHRTPGLPDLPHSRREAAAVAARLPNSRILIDDDATFDTVLSALQASERAHFACHADTDLTNPSRSGLLLHDHEERPLTVLKLARLNLGRAELAYLSACSTNRTSPDLTDEAIHITTAFQLAGYAHVIGTLWPIRDGAAAKIADRVYAVLEDGEQPAHALHTAIRATRAAHPTAPLIWASHVHVGT